MGQPSAPPPFLLSRRAFVGRTGSKAHPFQSGGCAGGLSSLRSRRRDWLLLIGITRLKMQLDLEFWISVLVLWSGMRALQRSLPPSMAQTVVLATALKPIRVGPIEVEFQIRFHVCSLLCSGLR